MAEEPIIGICRMCLKSKELKKSHIWPQFLYKDYIADLSRGGEVVAIPAAQSTDGRQVKRYWLCDACEGKLSGSEDNAAQLMRRMEKKPGISHIYDEPFFRYSISIC